jgi:hypothetical protein
MAESSGSRTVAARCAADLRAAVDGAETVLRAIDEAASGRRPAPDTWSPREVIGHLVDSASNNHRRFVMGQVQEDLRFPGYDQNVWVSVQRYREAPWANLVTLWTSFNRHLAFIIESTPDDVLLRPRAVHNLPEIGWQLPADSEPATLAHIVRDYIAHVRHHLAQIPDAGTRQP